LPLATPTHHPETAGGQKFLLEMTLSPFLFELLTFI
jgi:hypothetical protein